ncbi:MAG: hypothetical protein K2H06_06035 [Anaeroplasmataceae bacterium]|nr:hypothetical protein [Anaeroplasmataceae bacterium]
MPHWEEAGILCYQIRLPFEFSKVEGYTVYVKRESLENQLKDKITPVDILPNQTFNVRKTAALTSLLVFLCIGSFLTGNILLHYTSVNIILAWVLISICIITLPFMLYYVWKLDRWMNEK